MSLREAFVRGVFESSRRMMALGSALMVIAATILTLGPASVSHASTVAGTLANGSDIHLSSNGFFGSAVGDESGAVLQHPNPSADVQLICSTSEELVGKVIECAALVTNDGGGVIKLESAELDFFYGTDVAGPRFDVVVGERPTLAPGESTSLHLLRFLVADARTLTVRVTVRAERLPDGVSDSADISFHPLAIEVVKSGVRTGPYDVGDEIAYTITVTNRREVDAKSVWIEDLRSGFRTKVDIPAGGSAGPFPTSFTVEQGDISNGEAANTVVAGSAEVRFASSVVTGAVDTPTKNRPEPTIEPRTYPTGTWVDYDRETGETTTTEQGGSRSGATTSTAAAGRTPGTALGGATILTTSAGAAPTEVTAPVVDGRLALTGTTSSVLTGLAIILMGFGMLLLSGGMVQRGRELEYFDF